MRKKLYLAYGSNLNMEQMQWRCPDSKVYGETDLQNYKMTFRSHNTRGGVANIEPHRGTIVKALVWEISERDERSLDRYEGYPWLYTKKVIDVKVGDETVQAMVYVMTTRYKLAAPAPSYVNIIEQGYRDCGWDPREFQDWVMYNYRECKKAERVKYVVTVFGECGEDTDRDCLENYYTEKNFTSLKKALEYAENTSNSSVAEYGMLIKFQKGMKEYIILDIHEDQCYEDYIDNALDEFKRWKKEHL